MNQIDTFLKNNCNRVVGLDILRTVAIFQVVYGHAIYLFPNEMHAQYLQTELFKIDGVSIFFVLSGFLIGGILLNIISGTGFTRQDLLNFWIRRWFRTVPNYLFVLLCIVGYRCLIGFSLQGLDYKYFIFFQNFAFEQPEFFPETWSLSVEEWFYLLFPFSCFIFHKAFKNKSLSILVSILFFLFVPLILRILKYENGFVSGDFDSNIRKVVLYRLDSIMYGVLASYLYFKRKDFWVRFRFHFLIVGLLFVVLIRFLPPEIKFFYSPIYVNFESIAAFCFLPFLSTIKTTKNKLLDSLFIFISLISYSMYLLNLTPIIVHAIPTLAIVLKALGLQSSSMLYVNYLAYWILTVGGSYLLYRYYESPMTKLRDRIKI